MAKLYELSFVTADDFLEVSRHLVGVGLRLSYPIQNGGVHGSDVRVFLDLKFVRTLAPRRVENAVRSMY